MVRVTGVSCIYQLVISTRKYKHTFTRPILCKGGVVVGGSALLKNSQIS